MIKFPKTQRKTSMGTIAVSAIVGGLAGAAVALIFAPKSGKELRQGIQERAGKVRGHVGDAANCRTGALVQQGSNLVDKGKQLADDLQNFIHDSLNRHNEEEIQLAAAQDTQLSETVESQSGAETKAELGKTPAIVSENDNPIEEE